MEKKRGDRPKKSAIVYAKTEPIKAPYSEPLTTRPVCTDDKLYQVVPLNVEDLSDMVAPDVAPMS
jgi:hypothetical protein